MERKLPVASLLSLTITALLAGCGGGGSSNTDTNTNTNTDSNTNTDVTSSHVLLAEPSLGSIEYATYLIDGDNLLIVGGASGRDAASTHLGSDKGLDTIYVISLLDGSSQLFTMSEARYSHPNVVKISAGKYVISGGYQYATKIDLLDLNTKTIVSTDTANATTIDDSGLNSTPLFPSSAGVADLGSGKVGFFGFNNGLYAMDDILVYDSLAGHFQWSSANLLMARENAIATPLPDGRVLIVGGYDGADQGVTLSDSEIYDPADDSITIAASYPKPIKQNDLAYVHTNKSSDSAVCVGDYKYNVASNSWSSCDLTASKYESITVDGNVYNVGDWLWLSLGENSIYGNYIGTGVSGTSVLIHEGFESAYSSSCNCYPAGDLSVRLFVPANAR